MAAGEFEEAWHWAGPGGWHRELEEAWHWAGPGAWHREFEGMYSLSFVVFSVLIVASRVARWSLEMLMIALRISGVFGVSGPQEELSEQSREIVFLLADIVSSTCFNSQFLVQVPIP